MNKIFNLIIIILCLAVFLSVLLQESRSVDNSINIKDLKTNIRILNNRIEKLEREQTCLEINYDIDTECTDKEIRELNLLTL